MTDGSPAWKPHATFALETTSSSASSSPSVQRPKLSPISLFTSIPVTEPATTALIALPPHTMYSKSRLLVMNMCPGACVIANSGLDAITAACGVTPHAQNTGTSPGSNTGASP